MIKQLAVSAAIGAAVILPTSAATAAGGDPAVCDNFARPIIISQGYDPLHLDPDGNGIACEHNPGEPVKTDLYADLRGETGTPQPTVTKTVTASPRAQLPDTGSGNVITRHPVRSIALGVVVVGAGGGLILTGRRGARREKS